MGRNRYRSSQTAYYNINKQGRVIEVLQGINNYEKNGDRK